MIFELLDFCNVDKIKRVSLLGKSLPLTLLSSFAIISSDDDVEVAVNHFCYHLKKGSVCFALPQDAIRIYACASANVTIWLLPSSLSENVLNIIHFPTSYITDDNTIISLVEKLNCTDEFLARAVINLIASLVLNDNFDESQQEKSASFVRNSAVYIIENYKLEPTIDDLAYHLGYATHYVSTIFMKDFSKPFLTIVNELRIAFATQLLRSSNLIISEIATRSGYTSLRSFNRNFVLLTGVTPSSFRESLTK